MSDKTGDIRIDEIAPRLNEKWPTIDFENSLEKVLVPSKKFKSKEIYEAGYLPVIDQGEIFIAGYTNEIVHAYSGPLPVIVFGDHTRRFKYLDRQFAVGAEGIRILRPKPMLHPRFFYHYMCSLNLVSAGYSRHYKFLRTVPVPVPPLDEQRRIVAKLEALLARVNAARERLDKIPTLLKRFRQAVLTAACTGQLTADWRARNTAEPASVFLASIQRSFLRVAEATGPLSPHQADDLPRNWVRCSLSQLFIVQTGATPLKTNPTYHQSGTIPWVKTGEVQNGDIWEAAEHITQNAVDETNAKVFPVGTLLIAMYGEGKTRGQVGRLRIRAATNQACAALINPNLPSETNKYTFYYALSQYHRLRAEAVGGNQPNLSLSIIKGWELDLPPLQEQKVIIARLESIFRVIEGIEEQYNSSCAHTERLIHSILANAFSTELITGFCNIADCTTTERADAARQSAVDRAIAITANSLVK